MSSPSYRRDHGSPLPVRDGLNASRARVPDGPALRAWDFLWELISTQRYRDTADNEAALAARFAAGEVVNRKAIALGPDSLLVPGTDVFFYRMPAPETPVPFEITTIYEDDNLLVVDKPPFLATMPRARHITETATVRLRRSLGNNELTPAHRLDRVTSGVLVFTKRREIRGAYQSLFARREVDKIYHAIAARGPQAPTTWRSRMEKTPGDIQGYIVPGEINAVTELVAVHELNGVQVEQLRQIHGDSAAATPLARYELHPLTGKTHQLRLHMWAAGVPILGDPVYPVVQPVEAEDMSVPLELKSVYLGFIDPLSGRPREFSAPGLRDS